MEYIRLFSRYVHTFSDINLNAIQPSVRVPGLAGVPHGDKGVRLAGEEGDGLNVERDGTAAREDVDDALPRRPAGRPEVAQE